MASAFERTSGWYSVPWTERSSGRSVLHEENKGRVAIFIDGAYLDRVLKDEFSGSRISYRALSQELAQSSDILRTYYYHCRVYQSQPSTQDERIRYSAQGRFFEALERLPRYTVRLGRLALRGTDAKGLPKYEQKRVDILLGVDMVLLAAKQQVQEVVLVAGDSDFIPAISVAKSEGVLVRLYHGERPHSDLLREADERTHIDKSFVDSVLLTKPQSN